jgi:hypothetical protein
MFVPNLHRETTSAGNLSISLGPVVRAANHLQRLLWAEYFGFFRAKPLIITEAQASVNKPLKNIHYF